MKVFLPNFAFKYKYFYGHERDGSYYVIKCTKERIVNDEKLNLIGVCDDEDENIKNCFKFKFNGANLNQVSRKDDNDKDIHQFVIFLYNPSVFDDFNSSDYESVQSNFLLYLASVIQEERRESERKSAFEYISFLLFNALLTFSNILSTIIHPVESLFQKTSLYRHSKMWKSSFNEKRLRNGSIVFDILLGVSLCLFLNHIRNPENYFMRLTELVLDKLRMLLNELDGSPAGLKLNVQLNKFLHSCFVYHVDLWFNFITIVEPAITSLFLPLTVSGLMGFSFQCAMLCDFITLLTLHAHCFYIYAAMLYKLELTSLRSLWRIVLGRRLNVLKNRVESQEYSNRQLFLATLFFTTLLFLLPTIITYYVVFASLRLLIYCLTFLLMSLQRNILMFSFYKYVRWIFGLYTDLTNISFDLISHEKLNNIELIQFKITHLKSSPWKSSPFSVKCIDQFSKPLPIDQFAKNLIKGELMAFIPDE